MDEYEQTIKFSIIVPFYNVEEYIEKCVYSLLNQNCANYEILLIDDGSQDKSRELVEKIQEQNARIRIIAQCNKGLGGARNTGLLHAKGEYVIFIDSDDYVKENFLECIERLLLENKDVDILCYNVIEVDENGKKIRCLDMNEGLAGVQNVKNNPTILLLNPSACNKVYRREFFVNTKITFPEKTWYEDTATTRKLLLCADSIYFSNEAFYYYVQRQGSITHSKPSNKCLDIIKEIESLREFLMERQELSVFFEELEIVAVRSVLLFALEKVNVSDHKSGLQDHLVSYILEKFPKVLNNKYLSKETKKRCRTLLKKRYTFYHFRYIRWDQFKRKLKRFIRR